MGIVNRHGLAWAKWTAIIVIFHNTGQSLTVPPFSCFERIAYTHVNVILSTSEPWNVPAHPTRPLYEWWNVHFWQEISWAYKSVAFHILEVGSGIIKYISKYFKKIRMLFLSFFHWESLETSIREVLYGKLLLKTFPSSGITSSNSSPPKYWSKIALGMSLIPNSFCSTSPLSFSIFGLKAQALPLSLNVLMLYGNMVQFAKLCVYIFVLLAWTKCNNEFIIKYIINTSNFAEYSKINFK